MGSVSFSFEHFGQLFTNISGVFTTECLVAILPTAFFNCFGSNCGILVNSKVTGRRNGVKAVITVNVSDWVLAILHAVC